LTAECLAATKAVSAPFVSTVLGPIDPGEVGVTLMHEHLTTDVPRALGYRDAGIEQRRGVLARVDATLAVVADLGVKTFVDVGTQQFGPSPLLLLAAAGRSRVHIVCAVGCFPLDMMPAPAWAYPPATQSDIEEELLTLAERGVDSAGVRPGILKLGTGLSGINELEERFFRAAGAVHRRTGLAVTTHSHMTHLAEEQADLLADAGVDLGRVVIGHIGWGSSKHDVDRHAALADRGVTLGLDMIGLNERSLDEYVDIAVDLIRGGYSDRIVIAHDSTAASRGLSEIYGTGFTSGDPTVIHRVFLPKLRDRGVDEATIERILVANPRRILTIDPHLYPETRLAEAHDAPEAIVPFGVRSAQ
jgi:predicted metal-dependent phosphotriesterase family hydrolase